MPKPLRDDNVTETIGIMYHTQALLSKTLYFLNAFFTPDKTPNSTALEKYSEGQRKTTVPSWGSITILWGPGCIMLQIWDVRNLSPVITESLIPRGFPPFVTRLF